MSEPTDTVPAADPATPDPITEAALEVIRGAYPSAVVASETGGRHPWIQVQAETWHDIALLLRDHDELKFDCCHLVSGVDYPKDGELEAVYHLVSYSKKPDAAYKQRALKNDAFLAIKVRVPRDAPDVPSIMDVWTGADWHERETFDLVGINFTGREELNRILLPEDWPGHPLRKDWEFPASYHGIPIIPPEGL